MTLRPLLAAVLASLLVVAACGPSSGSPSSSPAASCSTTAAPSAETVAAWQGQQSPSVYPQLITPSVATACGGVRFMFSFLDAENRPVAAPDRTVDLRLYDLGADAGTPAIETEGTFIWAIEDAVGVYVADIDFPTAGQWGAEFVTSAAGAAAESIRVPFDVRPKRSVIGIGDPAPPSDTPTLADVGGDVTLISTDSEPVEAFYETSIADAVAAKEPFVVAFATPKFCQTQQCGPTLDRLKPIAAAHPDLTVINVEPYALEGPPGQLQPVLTGEPAGLTPVAAVDEWQLPTEPWVFVVDGDGIVQASFMLIFSDDELESAIDAVTGGA